ncbi:efflux RND transporter periplasmic adaptor subunit [Pseudomonas baetica]|uniref:Tc toxin subunit A-related protein n=1 Tax=Pseudomonas baetica TaxID=674054 RepID=UPI001C8C7054|nr:neuraminidase-like domain-containing protein [Pseudomonas baetica]MBX9405807.1 efflux RND transporter periplasmic adaptor subunit [Pseudomonas baetica]
MTSAFDAPLNEAFRDAMLALYLHEAVPNDPYLIEQGLTQQIKTANDLYEFWLLDVLISQDVPTSPVACAIASYQQQINSMMLNMEPGYSDDSFTPQQIKTWRDGLNRYPIWSAIQQLHYFPDIYLDPTLRLTKTSSFEQLENDLNQAQIQPETVQTAVLSYLAKFEEIANLKICNGYIDGEDFANSTYYFIGKSPAENAYYWRSLDMSQRPVKEPAAAPGSVADKFDKPLPNAWSDWQSANVPISEKALEHTIRPCWFNNRLFVIWAELELQDADAMQSPEEGRAETSVKVNPRFRLYASYKKYDDRWSTPRVYIESYCQTPALVAKPLEQIAEQTQTIAVYDHSTSPESMVIMLYSNYQDIPGDIPGNRDEYDFLRTVRIDKNFNVTSLFPSYGVVPNVKPGAPPSATALQDGSGHVLLIGHIFANKNAGRFQYWLPSSTPVFGAIEHATPETEKDTWDFNDWQSRIKTCEEDVELVYHPGDSSIGLTLRLNEGFPDVTTIKFSVYGYSNEELFHLTLVFSHTDKREWLTLLEGSEIKSFGEFMNSHDTVYCFRGWPDSIRSLISDPDRNNRTEFSVPPIAPGGSASLAGKLAGSYILDRLRDSPNEIWLSDVWRVPRGEEQSTMSIFPLIQNHVVETYGYQLFIGHPLDVTATEFPAKLEDIRPLYSSGIVDKLPENSGGEGITVPVDKISYQPVGWPVKWPDKPNELKIPLVYGVLIHNKHRLGHSLVGAALKAVSITWGETLAAEQKKAPLINNNDNASLGNAQYIDFTESSINFSDGCESKEGYRAPIRMNTTFARELIQLAESGMDPLLSWHTQTQQTEPPIPDGLGAQSMDFSGAYYLYFLELFLYLPWLVAYRLNEEQQYEEAKHWLAYLFNPSRQNADPGHPGYWQAVPLETPVWPGAPDPSQAIVYPDDPHQIALSFPVHFRKALYGLYIDIESNQADQVYRELTPDGLAEAKLRYVHILDLLGPRPDVRQVDDWSPITLDELSAAKNDDLRAFEQQLIATQRQLQEQPPLRIGKAPQSQDAPLLCLRPYREDSSLSTVDNPYLRRPFNPELIKRWDRAEGRLYNLRHNLDMAGNPLNLPLFAAPLDPRALLAAWGQGLSGAALSRLLNPQIPHYRFSFMFALAQNAVDSVIQFGSTLLSLIERKEQAQYLELQQQQAWNLAKVAVDIQVQAGKIDEKNKEALLASQVITEGKLAYYQELAEQGLSRNEKISNDARLNANTYESGVGLTQKASSLAKTIPNIFGFALGGIDLGAASQAVVHTVEGSVIVDRATAENADLTSQFDRRGADWKYMYDQAKLEAEQIEAQLAVYEEQHKATQLQLRQAQTALNHAKATHDFLLSSNRFSRSQTYDWLNSKFAGFYNGAYTTAQSLCQAAEACWQYEMGDFTQTFIRPGGWNATYRGLGAGEELKMSLQRMHGDYLKNNKRELEIRKTVSLKELKTKYPDVAGNKTWEEIKQTLTDNGTCEFELTQKMFDDDYAGQNHYLRRIKTISATLPISIGPYKDICAVLTQTYSKVEMAATLGNAKENLRASQQIALSHGTDDNGLFQLNFQDERYLPFECTGAISRWVLTLPNHEAQKAMILSLQDIILHLCYTARREGGSL